MSFSISKRPTIAPREVPNRLSVESVRVSVDELSGAVGDKQQRAVRLGELLAAGVLQLDVNGRAYHDKMREIDTIIGLQAALDGLQGEVDGLQVEVDLKDVSVKPLVSHNTNYTLALSDLETTLYHTGALSHNWTIPLNSTAPFPVGRTIYGFNFGTGDINFIRSPGVELYAFGLGASAANANRSVGDGSWFRLYKAFINSWFIVGQTIT